MSDQPAEKIKFRRILDSQMQSYESGRIVYHLIPEHGVTVDDLLLSETWAHVAKRLRPGTIVEADAADGSWHARLFVRSIGEKTGARVALLYKIDFDEADAEPVDYEIKWAGPNAKWRIVRGDVTVKDGFITKADAAEFLKTPKAA